MANEEHIKVVRQGAAAIAKFRADHPNQKLELRRADFTHSDLSGLDLRNSNLEWADFRWADLMGTDFSEANLEKADFHKADMQNVKLQKAILRDVNFEDANLSMAEFDHAIFVHTRLLNTDLAGAQGLSYSKHLGPSMIDVETLEKAGYLPSDFLRNCGLSDAAILAAYASDASALSISLESGGKYHSCFISYSSQDDAFANQLYKDLQNNDVRCWFAPIDMRIGDSTLGTIYTAIRKHEKLLIILSESSIASTWVQDEVEKGFREERDRKSYILFPIRIDDAVKVSETAWAQKIRDNRHIGDFRNWQQRKGYNLALKRLLKDLKIKE